MKVIKRGPKGREVFYYHQGQFRRAIHKLWNDLTNEIIQPVRTKSEAELYAAKIFQLKHTGKVSPTLGVAFEKVVKDYIDSCEKRGQAFKTLTQKRQQLLALKLKFVHQFKDEYLQDWLDEHNMSGASRNRYISTFNRFARFCKKAGYMRERLDLERYSESKEPIGQVISREQLELICKAAGEPFRYVIEIGFFTGMRRGEIYFLWKNDWAHVDFKERLAHLPAKAVKIRESKPLPLNKSAIGAIKKLKGVPCYVSADGITLHFKRVCARCGVKFRFHDLRHTFVSRGRLVASASQIARLVGHKDSRTTELIYTHYEMELLRAVIDLLD